MDRFTILTSRFHDAPGQPPSWTRALEHGRDGCCRGGGEEGEGEERGLIESALRRWPKRPHTRALNPRHHSTPTPNDAFNPGFECVPGRPRAPEQRWVLITDGEVGVWGEARPPSLPPVAQGSTATSGTTGGWWHGSAAAARCSTSTASPAASRLLPPPPVPSSPLHPQP